MTDLPSLLTEKTIEHFLKYCHVKNYPVKSIILSAGQYNQSLFLILEGSVSVETEDEEGKELIYAYLNKGQFIGEIGVFNGPAILSVTIKARCPCKLAEISYSRFKALLKQELQEDGVSLLFLLGKQLSDSLLMTNRNIRDLAFMDTAGRIARTLLDLCLEPDALNHPEGMQIKITRQELGRIVGCTREVAGKILKDLESKNMISIQGRSIVVFYPFILADK